MKYGLLFHKTSTNFGDDIQSYAISKFLPHIDYCIAREQIDSFVSENNEPVAVIMAAWWMWKKWNWPPAECIIPKLTSMHFNNYTVRQRATPMKNEWLRGIGKEFFDAYGPVGARDETSLKILQHCGIEGYLSGCITLTLPKQKQMEDRGSYVVLVDLKPEIKEKVLEWLSGSNLEIREFSHLVDRKQKKENYDERLQKVEEVLTLYQNAKFVVTQRLHVTLPCMAMEVPVFAIIDMNVKRNKTRWHPYYEWVNFMSEEEVLHDKIAFDPRCLPSNKQNYMEMREKLIVEIQDFIQKMESLDENMNLDQLKKTSYTKEEARDWQFYQMKKALDKWLTESRSIVDQLDLAQNKNRKRKEKILKQEEKIKKLYKKTLLLQETNSRLKSELNEALKEPTIKELSDIFIKKVKRKLKR